MRFAFRLGLVDAEFARCLTLVRRIRNDFAHETHSARLDSGTHLDRVRELASPFGAIPFFDSVKAKYFGALPPYVAEFKLVLSMLAWRLLVLIGETDPISSLTAARIAPDSIYSLSGPSTAASKRGDEESDA